MQLFFVCEVKQSRKETKQRKTNLYKAKASFAKKEALRKDDN
ncbi:hypothetical protein [Paenibacillus protaetiae]|nr:hypothetical protein [Paenibacillus protaetiae]